MFEGKSNKLIRNIERRSDLLRRWQNSSELKAKYPKFYKAETVIRDMKVKKGFRELLEDSKNSVYKRILKHGIKIDKLMYVKGDEAIKILNRRLFVFLNRLAALLGVKPADTSAISGMYASQYKNANKMQDFPDIKEIKLFFSFIKENNVELKSITGMQNGLGMPKLEDLKVLNDWCKENNVELKSITGMQAGLGMPKLEDLKVLNDWCKENRTTVALYAKSRTGQGIEPYMTK